MTYTEGMYVSQASKSLISVQLDEYHGDLLLHLIVMFEDSKNSLRHVVHDNIKIYFIWFVSLSIESMLQSYHVRMI